eukprot:1160673-Pelagomonas_calceolata.AAC.4
MTAAENRGVSRTLPFEESSRPCWCLSKIVHAQLVPNQTIGMTTGATIHTTNGLYMTVKERTPAAAALAGATA